MKFLLSVLKVTKKFKFEKEIKKLVIIIMAQIQQLDLPFSNGHFYNIPKNVPGRLNVDDFVFFNIPSSVDASEYTVVVTTLDTSQLPHRTIGKLIKSVELPHVHFGAHGQILLIPTNNPHLPTYYSRLNRGSTYDIPEVHPALHKTGMKYELTRHGVLTAGIE
jgi:hypothetical protein